MKSKIYISIPVITIHLFLLQGQTYKLLLSLSQLKNMRGEDVKDMDTHNIAGYRENQSK